ncbi:sugar phosphate isomerase/epimerase family protein [Sphingobacterium psychroaquaticum]|uniref:Sugar phosphate isomerase/epimerase n=1 Tax=Sphingobacterium psychroaquaticum TaxID=561061 RepID=A0A1X7J528_9SPHI|nr:sugar phosphate isomerase/epimerase [Sphingobacterium psychroaquaticum]QBQ40084.1 sugar phosphate isomerase/epimerase [Sphingobacterium psychroaquaticum]SMG22584.1 Sugar phosphate isomerase/epimerase [Sphingobacterium psychroaquaticum]
MQQENPSRRRFLKQAGLGLSAALVSPYFFSCETKKVGTTPFHNLGIQLYSIRDLIAQDPVKTLETVAKIGYKHVETFGLDPVNGTFWGLPISDLKKVLEDNGLKSHSGHYDMSNYLKRGATSTESIEKYIEIAHKLGQENIVAPVTPMDNLNSLSVADYQYAADQLNKAGELSKTAGIKVGYHNHFWEFRNFANGTKGLDILIAFTEPTLVDFELDLFWIQKAGYNAQSYFEKYPGRFTMWHMKDMDNQYTTPVVGEKYDQADFSEIMKQIRYTEVGTGAVDFVNIANYADKSGLKYAFVEQDDIYLPNKFDSIKKSFDYIQKNIAK